MPIVQSHKVKTITEVFVLGQSLDSYYNEAQAPYKLSSVFYNPTTVKYEATHLHFDYIVNQLGLFTGNQGNPLPIPSLVAFRAPGWKKTDGWALRYNCLYEAEIAETLYTMGYRPIQWEIPLTTNTTFVNTYNSFNNTDQTSNYQLWAPPGTYSAPTPSALPAINPDFRGIRIRALREAEEFQEAFTASVTVLALGGFIQAESVTILFDIAKTAMTNLRMIDTYGDENFWEKYAPTRTSTHTHKKEDMINGATLYQKELIKELQKNPQHTNWVAYATDYLKKYGPQEKG